MAARGKSGSGGGRSSGRSSQTKSSHTAGFAEQISGRAFVVLAVFIFIAVIFFGRLFFLQVIVSDEYSNKAMEARTANIETTPRRGTIYDRNGVVLATSVEASTIYVNPYEVTDVDYTAAQLSLVLGGEMAEYKEKLSQEDISFVYIERKADMEVAEKVKELELGGIYFISDTKRVYPNGQIGGQVIGFVNVDGEGISGLELYYDDILSGSAGTLVVERGADGTPIPGGVHEETTAVDGQDIIISLDLGMQEYLEGRLAQGCSDLGSEGGNSVIMDAATGEIYAAASLPYFNPSDTTTVEEGATTLKSVTHAFEPGSIFKTVAITTFMEDGMVTTEDTVFCPAVLVADGYEISDAHERPDMTMTVREILDQSSNVGMSLLTEQYGFTEYYEKIVEYNLTEATGVDYPGESSGYLLDRDQWSLVQGYNVSFGQGVSVTPLQMVRFYGAIANEGIESTPHFLIKKLNDDDDVVYDTEVVIKNKEAIDTVTSMLETVVVSGTGADAAIEGYSVAGKTGTAEIYDPSGGYKSGVYNISFVGFLPHSSSQLVCFVGATEVPGERTVTPIFSDIMEYAIDRYRIVPTEG